MRTGTRRRVLRIVAALIGIAVLLRVSCPLVLLAAVDGGSFGLARLALLMGADPNAVGLDRPWTALYTAAWYGDDQVVRALLDAGADIDRPSPGRGTRLASAIGRGYLSTVRILLANGADPGGPGWSRRTALREAVINAEILGGCGTGRRRGSDPRERLTILHAVIAAGADLEQRDRHGGDAPARGGHLLVSPGGGGPPDGRRRSERGQ